MPNASTHQAAAASMYLGVLLMVLFRVTAAGLGGAKLAEFLPPSSRGLGRRPLTAETGVRIPVAVLRGPAQAAGFRRSKGGARHYARQPARRPSAQLEIRQAGAALRLDGSIPSPLRGRNRTWCGLDRVQVGDPDACDNDAEQQGEDGRRA